MQHYAPLSMHFHTVSHCSLKQTTGAFVLVHSIVIENRCGCISVYLLHIFVLQLRMREGLKGNVQGQGHRIETTTRRDHQGRKKNSHHSQNQKREGMYRYDDISCM